MCRQGGVGGIVGQFSYPLLFSKASVVGASYKRRYTSISHANVEGDLEKRGRKGKCAIESSGGVGRLDVDGGGWGGRWGYGEGGVRWLRCETERHL